MTRTARLLNATNRVPRLQRGAARAHARLYELSGGRFLPRWFGAPVMVLETVGRRSGRPRATPVIYLRDGERLVVLPANAGSRRTPAWWLNLIAAGEGTAVVADKRVRVRPRVAAGEERARLWERFVALFPQAEDYLPLAGREIPLVVLEPRS